MEDDDSSWQDDEVETQGLYLSQRSNLEDYEKEICDIKSHKEREKCDLTLKDDSLAAVQENRLKSRRLHNPYLIDDAAVQENTLVPHLPRSPSTGWPRHENTHDSQQIWDTDLKDNDATKQEDGLEDCEAVLKLLDLSIQPHLTPEVETEDCKVQRNNYLLSSMYDFPSVATTTSILDTDEDSLDVCLSDEKVQATSGARSKCLDDNAEPKSSFGLESSVDMSATTESVVMPSSTTKNLEETDTFKIFPSAKTTDILKPYNLESTNTHRPHSIADPGTYFEIDYPIKTTILPISDSPEEHTNYISSKSAKDSDSSVFQPRSSADLTNELRSQSPIALSCPFRPEFSIKPSEYSIPQCPLESSTSSKEELPLQQTSSAVIAFRSHSPFEQTFETTNTPKLLSLTDVSSSPRSLSPIQLTNSPRSLSPVKMMDFLDPPYPFEVSDSPKSLSPDILTGHIKPQSFVESDSFLRPEVSEQADALRTQSYKEIPNCFRTESPTGEDISPRICSPEKSSSFFRPRPLSEQTSTKTNMMTPLSQIEIASLTTSHFPVPLHSSFTAHSSSEQTSSKILSPDLLSSARSQSPVQEFRKTNSPLELSKVFGNSSFRKPVNTNEGFVSSSRIQRSEELNDSVYSTESRLQNNTIPEQTITLSSSELRITNGRDSVHSSEELASQSEEERPIVTSSVTEHSLHRFEEVNPQVTSELRTEEGRSDHFSEEVTHRSPGELSTSPVRNQHSNGSAGLGGQDAERSRGLRRPSWLRASMRRVTHFQLAEPPNTLPPLATPDTVLDILENNRRPNSAPGGGGSRARRADFPRRYSSYSATVLNNSSSVTNLTQAAEPVAVESPSSEDDDDEEEEEEDVSSSSEGARSPRHQQAQQEPIETENSGGSALGEWPHSLSSMLASLGCTLGLFNISRFAIFSIHFGANFIVQFLLLTLVLGIPLFTLNTCLGQCLCTGVMDMWHISPIFQGVGIALIVSQTLIGIYSIVGISWMFIYFRDSFITKQDRYRWAEPYQPFREDSGINGTAQLEQTVPDYLNGVVLQRQNLPSSESSFGHIKFQVAFNLAVVWMIVFVSLSKGLKSYGKVVYVFSLFPVFGMLVLCTKLLGLTPTDTTHQVFPETVWSEFFLNTKSWVAALTEVFFTWGLLGAAAMQIASHNRQRHLLNRDTSLVIVLTLAVLLLAAFLANTCVALLNSHGYQYVPSSFEYRSTYGFLQRRADLHPRFTSTPVRYMSHTTLITGTRIIVPSTDQRHQSGYQVLRLATELVPATLALLGAEAVSPFWAVLFYFVIILFGIAQQLCIWHCVITGIMAINAASLKSWETSITFFSCAGGFILGLPMTTELGIFVVYFLDYAVGCAWWIMLLYLLEIIAVFVVRGRPYSGETVVATLFNRAGCLQTWAAPLLIFTWNVILPIALVVMCVIVFKTGHFHDLYDWRTVWYEYWAVWTREVGCMLQILPVVVVPLVCVIQTCRYLSNGPRDILERIQLLYRPSLPWQDVISAPNSPANSATSAPPVTNTTLPTPAPETSVAPIEDPPPKYTPPPSYTTATGARIAKLLRQSFRRSMRRLTQALSDNSNNAQPPPPDYAAVLVEINRSLQDQEEQETNLESSTPARQTSTLPNRTSTMTAADVAHILRSSFRRNTQRNRDAELLVDGAAPIHHDRGNSPPAPRAETESKPENSSVI